MSENEFNQVLRSIKSLTAEQTRQFRDELDRALASSAAMEEQAALTDAELADQELQRRLYEGGSLSRPSPAHAAAALHQLRQDFAREYRILEIAVPLLQRAAVLAEAHALRAYNAVQLAAVLEAFALDPAVTLVSADGDLNAAAIAEGLAVDDPNAYP